MIALFLGVSPLVKADPFGTAIKYPGIPCLIIAEVQVDGVSASMYDTVGAFVGAELRGKSKVVYSEGKAYVALMVNIDGSSNTVTLKVHVAETDAVLSATSDGAASLLVITAGTVGSRGSPALIEASTNSGGTGGDGVPPSTKPVITSVTAGWGGSLNATEANSAGTVTVLTSGAENGQTVTVTLKGKAYNGTVAVDSTVVTVASSDLQGLSDGSSYTLAANVSDAAGNAATEFNGIPFMVDTTVPSITSVTAGWGGSLNATEANSAGTVIVLTSGAENGQTVTITLNNVPYTGTIAGDSTEVTVGASDLQGLIEGNIYTLTANVSDAAGNAATEFNGIPFMVDTSGDSGGGSGTTGGGGDPFGTEIKYPSIPCLIIAEVQVDGVSASIHDTVGAFAGTELRGKAKVVYSQGKAYVALIVNIDGSSNTVTLKVHVAETDEVLSATSGGAASLLAIAAGKVGSGASPALIEASTNSGGAGGDGVPPSAEPVITSVTADWGGSLNATEANSAGTVTVVTSGAENGQTVTVTLNGKAYNGMVAVDSTEVTVAASDLQGLSDGSRYTLTANVSDAVGNAATEFNGIPFMVDTTAPSITSVTVGWGGSLNATEANSAGTVTVLTSGAENDQTVTVTLNSKAYTGTIAGDSTVITVAASDLQGLSDGNIYTLTANVSDAVGNAATEVKGIPFMVDTTAPGISDSTFTVEEDASIGSEVGILTGTDDDGDPLTYAITAGNDDGLFSINGISGAITVAAALDHETTDSHSLDVQVADAALSTTATVTVIVRDVNEAPGISDSTFKVEEDASIGSEVGILTGTDDDDDPLTYAITAGNDDGLFAINGISGAITVEAALDHETTDSHSLDVQVADAVLSTTATVTVIVRDVNEAPGISDSTFTVEEDASIGSEVGILTGTDDDGDPLTYAITAGNDDGLFAINGISGAITVAAALDHETTDSHSLDVQVADAVLSATATVTVIVSDVNEAPGISDSTFTVEEDASIGSEVGILTGTDDDDDPLTYAITAGNDDGLFSINGISGAITVEAALDHETTDSHNLTVTVTDTELASVTAQVTVIVRDVNEAPGISETTFTVEEDALIGSEVGILTGTDDDDDPLTYAITAGNDDGLFAINGISGAITVAAALDHETTDSHSLDVQVADAVLSATATVTVIVSDVNEAPGISETTFNVEEDASIGSEVGILTGTDDDDDPLTYAITAGNDDGLFAINGISGAITVAAALDHETTDSHSLDVQVADAVLSATATVTVIVSDVNEAPGISETTFNVEEDASIGSEVGILTGTDDDDDPLIYAITAGNDDGLFAINGISGAITVAAALDHETTDSHSLDVQVADAVLSATATVTVIVSDVNEAPGISDSTFTVEEDASIGSEVGILTGTDDDDDPLTYAITAGNDDGLFSINGISGAITVEAALDHETTDSHNLTVTVTDTELASVTAQVTVIVRDVNEAPGISETTFTVEEDALIGSEVGILTGTDDDDDPLTYAITAGNDDGLFAINGISGAITVAAALDHETTDSHSLDVQVADAVLSATATVTVIVSDVNEAPGISETTFNVEEDASIGSEVGILTGTDDDDDPLTYAITAGNDDGLFAINGISGAITVAAALDHETTDSHNLTVTVTDTELASATAQVTVIVAPEQQDYGITKMVTSVTTTEGGNAAFTIRAESVTSYRWKKDVDGQQEDITGVTFPTMDWVEFPFSVVNASPSINVTVQQSKFAGQNTFHMTNGSDGNMGLAIDAPTLYFYRGQSYTFNFSGFLTSTHPFYLSTTSDSSWEDGKKNGEYTSDVKSNAKSLVFYVPNDAPNVIYYHCANHAGMGGKIEVYNPGEVLVLQNVSGNSSIPSYICETKFQNDDWWNWAGEGELNVTSDRFGRITGKIEDSAGTFVDGWFEVFDEHWDWVDLWGIWRLEF